MKINKKIFLSLLPFLLIACNDFLAIEDESAINPLIWNNEETAKLYVNNIYSFCFTAFGGDELTTNLANISDETSDMSSGILLGTLESSSVGTYSAVTYEAIRYINIALEAMQSSTMTEAAQNRILGQLYFMRAWQHWKLVMLYGGVPYLRDYVTFTSADSVVNAPRNKTSVCIEYMMQDLDKAITMLPAAWESTEYSRVTRAAAATLKGRILLFYASPQFNPNNDRSRWKTAYDANVEARDICVQDGYSLLALDAAVSSEYPYGYNLNKVFLTKKTNSNPEIIWATPYSADIKMHGYENSVCPSALTDNTGAPSLCPSWDLAIAFPMKDGSLAFRYNSANVNSRTFIGNGGDISKFYLNRDPRFYSSIAFNGGYYELEGNSGRRQWFYSCPKKIKTDKDKDTIITYYSEGVSSARTSPTGFYCKKMVNPALLRANMGKSTTDWVEMRYAEVLLNLAECAFEYEGSNSELGYDCLKQIRSRAGIEAGSDGYYGLKSSSEITPIELVLNERRIELAFEGKRFYDLRRRNMFTDNLGSYILKLNDWKKSTSGYLFTLKTSADTTIFLYSSKRDTIKFDNLYKYFTMTAIASKPATKKMAYRAITDAATLQATTTGNYNFFDIPQSILTRSPALVQNYGWPNGGFNPFE